MQQKTVTIPAEKHVALVAHDNQKANLVAWCQRHKAILAQHTLYATGSTGAQIEKRTTLKVNKLMIGSPFIDRAFQREVPDYDTYYSRANLTSRIGQVPAVPCGEKSHCNFIGLELVTNTPGEPEDGPRYCSNRDRPHCGR